MSRQHWMTAPRRATVLGGAKGTRTPDLLDANESIRRLLRQAVLVALEDAGHGVGIVGRESCCKYCCLPAAYRDRIWTCDHFSPLPPDSITVFVRVGWSPECAARRRLSASTVCRGRPRISPRCCAGCGTTPGRCHLLGRSRAVALFCQRMRGILSDLGWKRPGPLLLSHRAAGRASCANYFGPTRRQRSGCCQCR